MLWGQEKGHGSQIQNSLRNTQKNQQIWNMKQKQFPFAHKVLICLNYPKCDSSLVLRDTQQLCSAFPSCGAVFTVELLPLRGGFSKSQLRVSEACWNESSLCRSGRQHTATRCVFPRCLCHLLTFRKMSIWLIILR